MRRFNLPLVAEGLTTYAIERQNGTERHQPDGAPPWAEQRWFWTDAILQGMARLDGLTPDPGWMEQFDQRLEAARGCSATETLPMNGQTVLIQELSRYISALESTGDDRRRQIAVAGDLLGDMVTHLSWGLTENGLSRTKEQAERALVRMTAQMPIRFTHISMGGDAGPHWVSGFVSGSVTDTEAVKQTAVYQNAVRDYPEITDWPTLCTVYVGRGLSSALGTVDASDFDLEIMNRTWDSFLDEQGVRWMGGPYQMTISATSITSEQAEKNLLLQGSRPLEPEDLAVYEHFASEDGRLTFCLDVLTEEEIVFGRQLSNEQDNSYITVYSVYDETTGLVDDTLDIELRLPHDEKWFHCELPLEVRESLRQKMDAFCTERYGEHLSEPLLQSQDGTVPPHIEQTM